MGSVLAVIKTTKIPLRAVYVGPRIGGIPCSCLYQVAGSILTLDCFFEKLRLALQTITNRYCGNLFLR